MSESPWSRNDIVVNLIAIIILMSYATIILLLKSWMFIPIYWLFWGLYFVIGRYVTCRHCDYLGKACPSWCMGKIGGKLYKRSDKKNFAEAGLWKMVIFDVGFLGLANIFPLVVYFYYYFSEGLTVIDWFLISIYGLIGIIILLIHQKKGCAKCTLPCPLSGVKHNK